MKESHERFIESADATFKKKYMSDDGTYTFPKHGQRYRVIERITKQFGNLFSHVKIDLSEFLFGTDLYAYFSLLNDCSAMRRLSIANFNLCHQSTVPEMPFRKLESLSFDDSIGSGFITTILNACNPLNLKILKLTRQRSKHMAMWQTTEGVLPLIVKRMVNIVELEIGLNTIPLNLSILRNMKNLKRLVMECDGGMDIVWIINGLAEIESLRELDLTYATGQLVDDDLSGAISNLKKVQRFTYSSFTSDLCVDLIIGYSNISMNHYFDADFERAVFKYTFTRSRPRHEK